MCVINGSLVAAPFRPSVNLTVYLFVFFLLNCINSRSLRLCLTQRDDSRNKRTEDFVGN